MTFHDFIYSLELGGGKSLMRKGLALLLLIFGSIWFMVSEFHGFREKEAMESAQVARQIAEGKGFTTQSITPQAIGVLEETLKNKSEPKLENFPELHQAPLYPYLLSTVFKLTGKPYEIKTESLRESAFLAERVICFVNIIFVYLTALALLVLGSRLFDARVGTLAAGLFVLSNLVWQFAISGLSTSLLMLLLVLLWLMMNEAMIAHEEDHAGRLLLFSSLAGLFLGLIFLTRLSLLWLLIPLTLLFGIVFYQRKIAVILFVSVALLIIVPFLIRNQNLCGSFFGAWGIDPVSGKKAVSLLKTEEPLLPLKMIPIWMIQGTGHFFTQFQGLLGGSFAAILAFASLFHLYRRTRARVLLYGSISLVPFLILGGCLVESTPQALSLWNMTALILPLLILAGSAYFFVLLDRLDLGHPLLQKAVFWVFVALNAIPLVLTLAPPREIPVRFPPYYPYIIRVVSQMQEKNEMIISDMPWANSWYGDRISVLLPQKIKDYYWIHDYVQPSAGFFMSPLSFDRKISEIKSPELVDYEKILLRTGLPQHFPLSFTTGIPPKILGDQDAYFYASDRPRWMEKRPESN